MEPQREGQPAAGDSKAEAGAEGAALSWTVQPWRKSPALGVAVALLILAVSFAVRVVFESNGWALLALVLLSLSVARYYAPTTYVLGAKGVRMEGPFGTVEREWAAFRAWFADRDGVLLSPFSQPTRLAFTRGIFLPFKHNQAEVLAVVEDFMGPRTRPDR